MVDNTVRDQFTEAEENPNLSFGDQFYQDPGGLNIGYGFLVTGNSGAVSALVAIGFNNNFTGTQWANISNEINALAALPASQLTANDVASLNTMLGNVTISTSLAQTLTDNYYNANVDSVSNGAIVGPLVNQLGNLGLTPAQITALESNSGVWAALQDLVYNAPGAITSGEVPNLNADLPAAVAAGNWGKVAYDIGFNPGTGVPNRRDDEALLALGFNAGGFAENNRTAVSPLASTSVNNASVISYEQAIATIAGTPHFANFTDTQTAVNGYLAGQGYYVPQSSSETFSTIAAQDMNGIGLTGAQLQALNEALPGGSLATGGLVYVPNGSTAVGSTPVNLSPLSFGSANSTYIYDAATGEAYAMGGALSGTNTGQVYAINSSGNVLQDAQTGCSVTKDAFGNIFLATAPTGGTANSMEVGANGTDTLTFGACTTGLAATTLQSFSDVSNTISFKGPSGSLLATLGIDPVTGAYDTNLANASLAFASGAQAVLSGVNNVVTLAANAALTLAAGATGNTVNATGNGASVNMSSAGGSVASGLTTMVGSEEKQSFSTTEAVEVTQGDHATVTGTDGTMTMNNPTSGSIQDTINWNAGGSKVESYTPGSGGASTENDTGFSGSNGTGTQLYTQATSTSSGGAISSTITGSGDTTYLNNATLTLSAAAQAVIDGTHDTVNAANGDSVTVGGNSNAFNVSSGTLAFGSGFYGNILTGSGNHVTGAGTDILAIVGGGNTVTGSGTHNTLNGTGNSNAFNLSSGTVSLNAGSYGNLVTGNANAINAAANAILGVSGNGNTFTGTGSGGSVFDYGNSNAFNLSNGAVSLNAGTYGNVITGNSLGVTAAGTNILAISGNGNSVTENGTHDMLDWMGGTGLTAALNGLGDEATIGSASSGSTLSATTQSGGETVKVSMQLGTGGSLSFSDAASGSGTGTYNETTTLQQGGVSSATIENVGTYIADIANLTAGGSVAESFNQSGIAAMVQSFLGANASGTETTNMLDFTTGNSQIQQFTGLSGNVTEAITGYSNANLTGSEKFTAANYTNNTSVVDFFAPTSGVASNVENFQGINASGDLTTSVTTNTDNSSADATYIYGGNNTPAGFVDKFYSTTDSYLGAAVFNASGGLVSGSVPGVGSFNNDVSVTIEDGGINLDGGGGYFGGGFELAAGAQPSGVNIGAIAEFDAKSHPAASHAAQQALSEISLLGLLPSFAPQFATSYMYEDAQWTGKTITWSLASSAGPSDSPFSGYMGPQYAALVQKAFAAWGAATGLTFQQVTDSSQTDIRLGWGNFNTAQSGVVGYTSYQYQNGQFQPNVIIRLEDPSQTTLTPGNAGDATYTGSNADLYQLLMHEIGHSLGFADNADPNSVMYYQATGGSNSTLDSTDVSGAQSLYGPKATQSFVTSATSEATINSQILQLAQATAAFHSNMSTGASVSTALPSELLSPPPLLAAAH
jgi:hypothetical protein